MPADFTITFAFRPMKKSVYDTALGTLEVEPHTHTSYCNRKTAVRTNPKKQKKKSNKPSWRWCDPHHLDMGGVVLTAGKCLCTYFFVCL